MKQRRGRVRAGVTGYHPTLQTTINPGEEYDVPVQDWSDDLFEDVVNDPLPVSTPEPQMDTEQPLLRRFRSTVSEHKED